MKRIRSGGGNGCGSAIKRMKADKSLTCNRCGVRYLQESHFKKHVESCSYVAINGKSVERAVNIACDMIYLDKSVEKYGRKNKNPLIAAGDNKVRAACKKVEKGWTKRPKWNESMGDGSIDEFRPQIIEWFNIGSACPAQKITSARKHQLLQGLNPHRYDLPSERQINSLVTSLSGDEKEARKHAAKKRLSPVEEGIEDNTDQGSAARGPD